MSLVQIEFPDFKSTTSESYEAARFRGVFSNLDAEHAVDLQLPAVSIEDSGEWRSNRWVRGGGFTFAEQSRLVSDDDAIEAVTMEIYRDLLAFRAEQTSAHLIKFWNFVPHINRGAGDLEIYKRFSSGRLAGFRLAGISEDEFPAASALGHKGDFLTVHMLLSDKPGVHKTNPLQIDAFRYPAQYGSSSPSFARATEVTGPCGRRLVWISGTASIRGHESLHVGDVIAQTQLSLENVGILLEQSNKTRDDVQSLRVYLRHAEDLQAVRSLVDEALPSGNRVFLQADICRAELLVEIECTVA